MLNKILFSLIVLIVVLEIGGGYFLYTTNRVYHNLKSVSGVLTSHNENNFGINNEQLPTEDVLGVDPIEVPRYPYLVRTYFEDLGEGKYILRYQSHQPENLILTHYKAHFARAGWILESYKNNEANFVKDAQKLSLKTLNKNGLVTFEIKAN